MAHPELAGQLPDRELLARREGAGEDRPADLRGDEVNRGPILVGDGTQGAGAGHSCLLKVPGRHSAQMIYRIATASKETAMTTTIFAEVRVFDGDRLLDGTHDVVADGPLIASVKPGGTLLSRARPAKRARLAGRDDQPRRRAAAGPDRRPCAPARYRRPRRARALGRDHRTRHGLLASRADRGAAAGRLHRRAEHRRGRGRAGKPAGQDPRAPRRQHRHEPGGRTPVRRGPPSPRRGLHQGHRGPARPRRPRPGDHRRDRPGCSRSPADGGGARLEHRRGRDGAGGGG